MYTLYVDESGDSATSKIRTTSSSGATPYMVLDTAFVHSNDANYVSEKLLSIQDKIGKNHLHCNELKHFRKRYFARIIADCNTKFFAVISHKKTLGKYKAQIGSDTWKYYHKCLQYLLEIFGMFLQHHQIPPSKVSVAVEKSNSFVLTKFQNYIRHCQNRPEYKESAF